MNLADIRTHNAEKFNRKLKAYIAKKTASISPSVRDILRYPTEAGILQSYLDGAVLLIQRQNQLIKKLQKRGKKQ